MTPRPHAIARTRPVRLSRGAAAAACSVLALAAALSWPLQARAEAVSRTAQNPSVTARLDFAIEIGKFVYLSLGTEAAGAVDTIDYTVVPSIPAGNTEPDPGNRRSVSWNRAAPGFTARSTNNVLQVAVRSNSGTVSLQATNLQPLTRTGGGSIPLSQFSITSNQPTQLPAPSLTTGATVNVPGSSLVTVRNAAWTFNYTPATMPAAGVYEGTVNITATNL